MTLSRCSAILFAIVYFCPRFSIAQTELDVTDVCTLEGRSCARNKAFDNDFQCCDGLYCNQDFWSGIKTCIKDPNYVPTSTTPKPPCGTDRESCTRERTCCEPLTCIGPRQGRVCSDLSNRGPRRPPAPDEPEPKLPPPPSLDDL